MNKKSPTRLLLLVVTLLAPLAVFGQGDTIVPANSKVFIDPMGGFENHLIAAFEKKQVPLLIVSDKDKADFEIAGVAESQKAGWAKTIMTGASGSTEEASINMKNIQSGAIVFAYQVHKGSSVHGKQSSAEACAKHLKEKILKNK
jgi:hypothetical protein